MVVACANVENQLNEAKEINKGPLIGVRHVQMLLLFLLIMIGYAMRVNLSVGIVAMLDNSTNPDFPTYDWDDKDVVLSSFFWGYILPQIGAGQMAKYFGPKWILVTSMSVCSLFSVLIPIMADQGSWGVMICRIIQGFSQGFFYPCTHNLISKWAPLDERTRLGTFVYSGGPFGTVISLPVTGWICGSAIGWPSVFYIFGAAGFLWALMYAFLGCNNVGSHKSITAEEKKYLQDTVGGDCEKRLHTPWMKILTSVPVWAILITHCGQNWGFWTLLTEISSYMKGVLNYDIQANGLLSALPYFTLWILSFIFSALSDIAINRKIISTGVARKIMTALGMLGPAGALLGLGLAGEAERFTCIALLVIAVGVNSATYCGYQVNHIDLSPNHAGTLMGITNGMANIFSIIAPLVVQFIVTDDTDADQWKYVWFIAAIIYFICSIVYCVFGSGETQSWDADPDKVPDDNISSSNDKEKEANKY